MSVCATEKCQNCRVLVKVERAWLDLETLAAMQTNAAEKRSLASQSCGGPRLDGRRLILHISRLLSPASVVPRALDPH
jgi:hypothetical protein